MLRDKDTKMIDEIKTDFALGEFREIIFLLYICRRINKAVHPQAIIIMNKRVYKMDYITIDFKEHITIDFKRKERRVIRLTERIFNSRCGRILISCLLFFSVVALADVRAQRIDNPGEKNIQARAVSYPDNVVNADCTVPAGRITWSIDVSPILLGTNNVSTFQTPYVGDLDGDGHVEIVVAKAYTLSGGGGACTPWSYYTNGMLVFDRGAGSSKEITTPIFATGGTGQIGLARPNASSPGLIVLSAMDGYLYAYDKEGNPAWGTTNRSDAPYTTYNVPNTGECYATGFKSASILFSDFNGDGNAEIVTGDRIFDLATGKLLLDCEFSKGRNINLPIVSVVDVNKDGKPELVWGGNVYSVDIVNQGGTKGNSCTLLTEIVNPPLSNGAVRATIPADFDRDGRVDILCYGRSYFYVYNPLNGAIKVKQPIPLNDQGKGIPLVGDIDGDRYPEIVYGETNKGYNIIAWDIDVIGIQNQSATVKWRKSTTDDSQSTGLTLFDFDQDGRLEILYRDHNVLRIFNGASQATMDVTTTPTIDCVSGALFEYPITADVDNDGEAEIIVTGTPKGGRNFQGYVFIFNPRDGIRWAPARKVWNQYAYNALNINEDLTVPTRLFDIAAIMAGPDTIAGTKDDVQPYNGFLKQSTMIDRFGNMIMYTTDVQPAGKPAFFYDGGGDSLRIVFPVVNNGEQAYHSPLCAAAYRDSVQTGNRIATDSLVAELHHNETLPFTFVIRNFSSIPSFDDIRIVLNDRGKAVPVWTECKSDRKIVDIPRAGLLIARNDHVLAFLGAEAVACILQNDSIPSGCAATPEIVSGFTRGHAVFSGDTIRYVSTQPGFDTLVYRLACNGDTAIAKVCVHVSEKPDNISDADCFLPASATKWDIERKATSDVQVYWLATPFVGDLDGDGKPEIVAPDNPSPQSPTASAMLIFNDSLRLIKRIAPPYPMPDYHTMSFLIADVDNDKKGDIVVATTNRTLYCYDLDSPETGSPGKWGGPTEAYSAVYGSHSPSLVAADVNGDGHVVILAADKIYDGATGKRLVTLPAGGRGFAAGGPQSFMPVFADMDNDGRQEVVAGNTVYKITINDYADASKNSANVLAQIPAPAGYKASVDGFTSVADIDLDGDLDVIVTGGHPAEEKALLYVWDGATPAQIGQTLSFSSAGKRISRAFAGDVSGDGRPDIAFTYTKKMEAYSYNPAENKLNRLWEKTTSDASGATTMSMFDFNQDGKVELVYRDESHLRIIDHAGNDIESVPCGSATHTEYPVVVDLDGDGHADILVSGSKTPLNGDLSTPIYLHRFGSATPGQWASARPVWNQHAYNAVNINDDLTVPASPLHPATAFPGKDGRLGTDDDVRPYNAFLQQQTTLHEDGVPIWITPNAVFDAAQTAISRDGDSVSIRVCIVNHGSAALGAPVYASLYRDDAAKSATFVKTDSIKRYILPGDTACLTIGVADVRQILPFVQLVVRLNDKNGVYPFQLECVSDDDSTETRINPALDLMMKMQASLDGVSRNGRYENPVSALHTENVAYRITAVNANLSTGAVTIVDTLPPYLQYVPGSASAGGLLSRTAGHPPRDVLTWKTTSVAPLDTVTVSFEATPESGAGASQAFYVNRAWVWVSDTLLAPTNNTYHQGAGIAVVTFSASVGGSLYNAGRQALDYRTSPRPGILIVPDSACVFTGWSHDAYLSLRGRTIPADSGIMNYDSLVIYGNVELRANFAPAGSPIALQENAADEASRETADQVWANGEALYVRAKEGVTVCVYTPDGVLQRRFVVARDGISTCRPGRGVYIVTLNGGTGYKVTTNY
jgi:hypothetical protein